MIIVGLHSTLVLFQYVLTQIYLGRSHICRSLFLAILGRRKKVSETLFIGFCLLFVVTHLAVFGDFPKFKR